MIKRKHVCFERQGWFSFSLPCAEFVCLAVNRAFEILGQPHCLTCGSPGFLAAELELREFVSRPRFECLEKEDFGGNTNRWM